MMRDFYQDKSRYISVNKLTQNHYTTEKEKLDMMAIDLTINVLHRLQNDEIDKIKLPKLPM